MYFFCFKQQTAYEMRISDWSSDVCSSDLDSRRHTPDPPPLPVHVIIMAVVPLKIRMLAGIIVGLEEDIERHLEPVLDLFRVGIEGDVGRDHAEHRGDEIGRAHV